MIRRIDDFATDYQDERSSTIKILQQLTDASLAQRATPESRSLGFLAWHVTTSIGEMLAHCGITVDGPSHDAPQPASAAEILQAYQRASASAIEKVSAAWSDDMVDDDIAAYGMTFKRGQFLAIILRHEAHHRGQMTVLMRMAGLPVAGPYGPSREEWLQMGMQPQA